MGREVKICLVMVVRDQDTIIRDCFESVSKLIDTACIIDTGSTDWTVEVVEEWLEKSHIPGIVQSYTGHAIPAPLFALAAARMLLDDLNYSLEDTYFLWLDGDSALYIDEKFQKNHLVESSYLILETSPFFQYSLFEKRLLSAKVPWVYRESIHPQWIGLKTSLPKKLHDIVIKRENTSLELDIEQLNLSLQIEPANGRYLLQLAQSYKRVGEYERAIEVYKKRIDLGLDSEEVWFSKFMIGSCYEAEDEWQQALHWYMEAYQMKPERPDPLQKIAARYRQMEKNNLAFLFAEYGAQTHRPMDQHLFDYPPLYDYQFDEEISIAAYYTRYKDEGRAASDRLLLHKNVPYWIKDQNSRNLFFYAPYLKEGRFRPLEIPMPPIIEGSLETYHPMNLSIVKTADGYKMLVGSVNYTQTGRKIFHTADASGVFRMKNFILEFDIEFRITRQQEIVENLSRVTYPALNAEGLEDGRLFEHLGRDWFSCTTNDTNPNGFPQISLCQLSNGQVERLTPLLGPSLYHGEKNWLPFHHNGQLQLIYSYDPFTIYTPDLETGACTPFLEQELPFDFSRQRGSAPPIPFDDGYLLLTHEIVPYPDSTRAYLHRFLYLSHDLEIKKISRAFVFLHQGIERCTSICIDHSETQLILPIVIEDREPSLCFLALESVRSLMIEYPGASEARIAK